MSDAPKKPGAAIAAILAAAALAAPLTVASEGWIKTTSPDPIDIPTVCAGIAHAGAGKTYTDEQCVQMTAAKEVEIGAAIDPCIKVPIPDRVRAAFTDFAYNVGPTGFCRSSVATRLNAGDLPGACASLSLYVYANHKPFPGLVRRRQAERALCETALAEDPAPIPAYGSPVAAPEAPAPIAKPSVWHRMREWFA